MNIEMAVDVIRQLIITSLLIACPILLTSVFIGVFISILQSVTSIQEQTLTFVPKLFGVGLVVIISAHWMIRTLMEFCVQYIDRIAYLAS